MQVEPESLIALEAIMDRIHAAILSADFSEVTSLEPELEQALAEFDPMGDESVLGRLREKADRNARCLKAARSGVRSALRRLEEIRANGEGLMTYDAKGQRNSRKTSAALSRRY